jgi:hypothetical protein
MYRHDNSEKTVLTDIYIRSEKIDYIETLGESRKNKPVSIIHDLT